MLIIIFDQSVNVERVTRAPIKPESDDQFHMCSTEKHLKCCTQAISITETIELDVTVWPLQALHDCLEIIVKFDHLQLYNNSADVCNADVCQRDLVMSCADRYRADFSRAVG